MKLSNQLWCCVSAAALLAAPGFAQEDGDDERTLERVTVTGSFIPGTPEDAALPVDVLTAQDLRLEGSPSITELIRNLGVSSGVDGQTNQFASNGLEGTSNVNLRGLGPGRTLVLLNGKRQTFSPYAVGEQAQLFVDTNMIPSAAIGRIEVLKDGAAALYGSDAIAGVVNFITRDDLDGLELSANFTTYEGTDGEWDLSAAYGVQGDNWNWVTSIGYQKREEVPLLEKDWAILSFEENPVGGWSSLSNPGRYVPLGFRPDLGGVGPLAANVNDLGCEPLGGILAPTCRFQFTQFDNLVEQEERYQFFTEYNNTFSNGAKLHLEALYGYTDVPSWKTSPSYPPQELATQVVPVSNPGFAQYIQDNPGAFPDGTLAALYIGRSFGWGGFPATGGAQEGFRELETFRLAGTVSGETEIGLNYNVGLTYSQASADRNTNDTYILGFTAALNGFGLCTDPITGNDPATGTQPFDPGYTGALQAGANGCEWYNPFSNGIPASAITGEANPNYVPGLENSPELADWLTDGQFTAAETSLLTFDGVFSGESPLTAPGGNVGWAAGFQVRRETYALTPDRLNNLELTPGPGGTGPFSFLAGFTPSDEDQTIYSLFGELQVPLYDNLDIQVAMRYEDYGGDVGSTFDPKVAAKWQVSDAFALRGSAQTSFKGPTLNQLSGQVTTLQFVAPASAFKAVDQIGNPNLSPESAFSWNVGGLLEVGNFSGSIDYYSFDFSDPIIVEDQASIVSAALASIQAEVNAAAADSRDPDANNLAAIVNRIRFEGGNPFPTGTAAVGSNVARVETFIANGPDIETSGIDLRGEYVIETGVGNELTFGVDATYILDYEVGDFAIEDQIIAGGDRAGQFNRSNFSRSLPQFQANLYGNLSRGDHNLRAVVRHVGDYTDERAAASRGNVGDTIDSQTTLDLFYNWQAPFDFDLGLSVVNVTDQDPPFAAFDLNYDPYTHNPFGRTFKVSVTKRFGPGE
ncbi:MAG: TonB-dependent receptor [Pseudomonadota bacterium]